MPVTLRSGKQVSIDNDDFLSMLAHELRNPLAPMVNAIHIIASNDIKNPVVQDAADVIVRQATYIVNVVNDLLDLNKINKNKLHLNKKQVDICSLIRTTIDEFKKTFSVRQQAVYLALPNQTLWVFGDEEKLKKILFHILQNAAKFTETDGEISITANHSVEDNSLNITIKDTGIGIRSQSTYEIFDLFSNSDPQQHLAHGGGLGIGLALASKIAEMHGGAIEAGSGGINKGSEFTIILPLSNVTEHTQDTLATATAKSRKILVVDDHPDTAETTAILLKIWKHDVRICHNGITAIDVAKDFEPNIILLNIGLPGFNGYEVAKRLKQECPHTLLIAMTGYGQKIDRRRSMNAGFHIHLVKPVSASQLKEALETTLP